jgi:hypothetical protein
MTRLSPDAVLASLSEMQRQIVPRGPTSFAEADALPEGLFEEDVDWNPETGDEHFHWSATALGCAVRDLLEAQERGQAAQA